VRHPAFLDQVALHADLGRHCGHHARVIGLHAADRDQRVGIARDRIGTMYSSLRNLLPPNARPELQSSRLAKISTSPPRCAVRRDNRSMGVGPKVRG
jgi:hypothetical protein